MTVCGLVYELSFLGVLEVSAQPSWPASLVSGGQIRVRLNFRLSIGS